MIFKLHRYFLFILVLPFALFAQKTLENTVLQLSWFNQFQFAGYYIAKEKGFYSEYGLDVEIKNYDLSINVTKDVSEGKVDFGIAKETLIPERITTFHNVVALYPLFQISPLILIAKKDSNINTFKDFLNQRIMLSENDASQASVKAMLSSNNINIDSLKLLKHNHNIEDLINNKTDIISGYISKYPFELKEKNGDYYINITPYLTILKKNNFNQTVFLFVGFVLIIFTMLLANISNLEILDKKSWSLIFMFIYRYGFMFIILAYFYKFDYFSKRDINFIGFSISQSIMLQ